MKSQSALSWFIFVALSLIWGSSFILMKKGLEHLSSYQVASIRIIASGLVLSPIAVKAVRNLPKEKIWYVFLSGLFGSLLPAYLFCMAEEGIDSSLAGVLNSLTPIFVIIIGALFFGMKTGTQKLIGILIAFSGSVLLFLSQPGFARESHFGDVLLIVLATVMYGLNVNMVRRFLTQLPSMQVAAVALGLNAIPAAAVLWYSGYFRSNFSDAGILSSSFYSCILGVFSTAIASVIFYVLIKKAGPIFSSMVTYGIPFVAIGWGLYYGETVGWKQVGSLCVILTGVWIANTVFQSKKTVT